MAQRRMFSPQIVESDAFLDMPLSSQALYFHLGIYADDDGFVNPNKIVRMLGTSPDDLKVLLAKKFVLPFESGVIVIKHWRINNFVRKDRYRETPYLKEKSQLFVKENQGYSLNKDGATPILDAPWKHDGQPMVNHRSTQDRLGKDRIEDNIAEDDEEATPDKPQKVRFEPVDAELAQKLLEAIRANLPSFKQPNLDKWAEHVRLMRERDSRTVEQIGFLIVWCQKDSFWKANILSTAKLREKFDQLAAQAVRNAKGGTRQPVGRGVA